MPGRVGTPSRFSKRTKASKPAAAVAAAAAGDQDQDKTVISDSEEERESPEGSTPSPSTSRGSAGVIVTPRKPSRKRPRVEDEQEQEQASTSRIEILVTPVKASCSTTPSLLPTPPYTPTDILPSLASPSSCSNVYARARALLRLSAPASSGQQQELVGRDVERRQLLNFLKHNFPGAYAQDSINGNDSHSEGILSSALSHIAPDTSPSTMASALYISGSPGTGKTALLTHTLADLEVQLAATGGGDADEPLRLAPRPVILNCNTVRSPGEIWSRLSDELGLSRSAKGKGRLQCSEASFARQLRQQQQRRLVVLDEIDSLLSSEGPAVLSSLFRLALDSTSNLVLIGIANALDLTNRYLGDLVDEHGNECMPELLHFRPFQAEEMVAIARLRLQSLLPPAATQQIDSDDKVSNSNAIVVKPTVASQLPIMMPAALELAAKKVAAVTGDLRSFLSLVRKAVELFEVEQRRRFDTLQSPTKSTSAKRRAEGAARSDPLGHLDATSAPTLTPAHILKAVRLVTLTTSAATGSSSPSGQASTLSTLSSVSQSSTAILEVKISDLNLHQRIALAAFTIAVDQSNLTPFSTPTKRQKHGEEALTAVRPGELYALYRTLLEKEDLLRPVSSAEFNDLLSGLHTRGLVAFERDYTSQTRHSSISASAGSLAVPSPPMMRRTSSSSASSASSSSRSRSSSPSAAQAPLVLTHAVRDLKGVIGTAKPAEAASICSAILQREEKRIRRIKFAREQEEASRRATEDAPSEGFNGDGLDQRNVAFVGKRANRGRAQDDDNNDDQDAHVIEEDHEKAELTAGKDDGEDDI